MPHSKRTFCLLSAACIFMLPLMAFSGQEHTVDGTLHIVNGAEPSKGEKILTLEEQWRMGGGDDGEIFGLIVRALIADDRVYLLDTQLSEVKVYDTEGNFIRTLSREGEGPGEVRMPADMLFLPDGTLGLVQLFPGKVTKLDLEGNPTGVFKTGGDAIPEGGFLQFYNVKSSDKTMVLSASLGTRGEGTQTRTTYVASYDMDGHELVRYESSPYVQEFSNFKIDESKSYCLDFNKWALGEDGRVYTASYRNDYALNVYNPDGSLDRVIKREYEPIKRTADQMQEYIDSRKARVRVSYPFEVIPADTDQTIRRVTFGPDGNLWVQSGRSNLDLADGIIETYDIFDPDGNFIYRYALKCEGDGKEDVLHVVLRDQAIQVTGYFSAMNALLSGGVQVEEDKEPAPMEIIYHRVRW